MSIYTELIAELENEQEYWAQYWVNDFVSYLFTLGSYSCSSEIRLKMLTDQGEEATLVAWARYQVEKGDVV